MSEEKKVKASDRLATLENLVVEQTTTLDNATKRTGEMEMILYNLSRESEILRDALQLMHDKLEAVVALSNGGKPLTNENINETVTSLKEQSLKDRVTSMEESGHIAPVDVVGSESLIISRELDEGGTVVNPRLQFMVGRLNDVLKSKFVGRGTGDLVPGEENKLDIEIMEIYDFVDQKLSEEPSRDGEETEKSE